MVPPEVVINFLSRLFAQYDRLVEKHRVQKIDTVRAREHGLGCFGG